jgi:hypothetical protein
LAYPATSHSLQPSTQPVIFTVLNSFDPDSSIYLKLEMAGLKHVRSKSPEAACKQRKTAAKSTALTGYSDVSSEGNTVPDVLDTSAGHPPDDADVEIDL